MAIHDNDTASVVTVTKEIVIPHGEDTDEEEILKEAIHRLQTGRGEITDTSVDQKSDATDQ